MALDREKLVAVGVLKDLSAEQITAITNLSQSDEASVISEKTAEAYSNVDKAVGEVLGASKPHGILTSAWVKEEMTKLKSSAKEGTEKLKTEIETLKADKTKLEEQIKAGDTSGALKQQIADKETQIEDLRKKVSDLETTHKEALATKDKELITLREDHEFNRALSGVTFISETIIPKETRELIVKSAKSQIRDEYKTEWDDSGRMIFRDKNNRIVTDPDNLAEPMTPGKMLTSRLKGVIDEGKTGSGGGSGGNGGAGGNGATLESLAGVTKQVDADKIIRTHLNKNGYAAGTVAFQEKFSEIWKEHKIDELDTK